MRHVRHSPGIEILPLDPAEISNPVHRIAKSGEQRKAAGALVRIGVVDGHLFKEPVDRSAQGGERRHRIGELLRFHRLRGARGGSIERVDQRLFGGFRGVGKGAAPSPAAKPSFLRIFAARL